MELKRHYRQTDDGENIVTAVTVLHSGKSPRQNFSHRFV